MSAAARPAAPATAPDPAPQVVAPLSGTGLKPKPRDGR